MSAYTFLGHELRDGMAERWPTGIPIRDERDGSYINRVRADEVPVPRCVCGHAELQHGYDRRGRAVCRGSSVCGCGDYISGGSK